MTPPVSFTVFGDPKGQPRARACVRGKHAGTYDPGTADAWKFAVREAARVALSGQTFGDVPIRLTLQFWFKRPKSHCRADGSLRPGAPVRWHTQKPDRDNCEKAVLDALTTLGVWDDDCQVCCGQVSKRWANRGLCDVTIEEVEE